MRNTNKRTFAAFLIAVGKVMLQRDATLFDILTPEVGAKDIDNELVSHMMADGVPEEEALLVVAEDNYWALLRKVPNVC